MTLQEQIRLILDTNIYANYSCDGWSSIDGKDEAIAKLIELMITNRDEAVREAQPKWISVEEQLPDENARVLTLTNEGLCRVLMFGSVSYGFPPDVTHWMPIPPFKP